MNPTVYALVITAGIILGVVVICFAADAIARCSVRKKIEKLRISGVIAPEGQGSDADIIRLANEGKRDPAAYYYVALHGGRLEAARTVVGTGAYPTTLLVAVYAVLVCVCAFTISTSETSITLLPAWIAIFVVMMAAWDKNRKLIKQNRETLAAGKLPEPFSCGTFFSCKCKKTPKDGAA
jgi:hypothetical protein